MSAESDAWKEAAIAWEVCKSLHATYAKGIDPFFTTRQGDYKRHADDARFKYMECMERERNNG